MSSQPAMGFTTPADRNAVIRALLTRLDEHSAGERSHAERVAVYATATGEAMGMTDDDLQVLRYAAQLHDVGKARVDAGILQKLGELEDSDFGMLRLHAVLAMEVIGEFDFLQPCVEIIRHHHERWDGKGYPDGLAGAEIPLSSRIIGLTEAFDSITFPSAWKSTMAEAEAIEELRLNVGTQFDPAVFDAFLTIQAKIQPVGL